jgi:hypothetical protein
MPGVIFTTANQDRTVFLDSFLSSFERDKKERSENGVVLHHLKVGKVQFVAHTFLYYIIFKL